MTRTRVRSRFACSQCGGEAPKWLGRCPDCGAWGTLEEQVGQPAERPVVPTSPPVPIAHVDPLAAHHRATGVGELDRVLGGGLVAGSVTLLGGEPGIGKSTLVLQALAGLTDRGARVLLVTGEESLQQVRLRAGRLGALSDEILLASETSLPAVLAHLDAVRPDVAVIDSIQTVVDPELSGAAGSVGQVRDCATELVRHAKRHDLAMILVGHVTKEGTLAGPRVLEHVVDTVLAFEGERHHALRVLRAHKHRFGSTEGLGLFQMTDGGLVEVADPSAMLLADRQAATAGSVVTCALDRGRPMLVEVQALVAAASATFARRSSQGIDAARLAMLLAVMEERAGVVCSTSDVYASVAGGMRACEPAVDLALVVAVASAAEGRPVPDGVVFVGEVGLGGEVRQVGGFERRCVEASRMGHHRAVVPASSPQVSVLRCERVQHVADALRAAGLTASATRGPGPS